MYCSNCGKEIAEESTFCSYCGEKQQIVLSSNINDGNEVEKSIDEVTGKTTPIDNKSNSNIVADEIIANLKMVGLAILLSAIFIGIFWACHINDRKPVFENYYGYSCYDPPMMQYYETDWEKIFSEIAWERTKEEILYSEEERKRKEDYQNYGIHSEEELFKDDPELLETLKQSRLIRYPHINKTDEELVTKAKEIASRNKKDMEDEINRTREWRAEEDLKDHLRYSILISLAITLLGRYLIKGIKWVAANKT